MVSATPQRSNDKAVGVDLGIEHFATLSDGQVIDNPRFFKKEEKAIAKIQRKLSKEKKGSVKRRKLGKQAAKIHRRIRNKRSDFCHKAARKLVQEYQYICVEDLNTKKMVQEAPRPLTKSILDASWNQFCQILTYKAAEAGRKVGMVNPAYTSQTCSRCGTIKTKTLSERHHKCLACGHSEHRDVNAAKNILAVGLHGLGLGPRSPRLSAGE
jgi:putative transposase